MKTRASVIAVLTLQMCLGAGANAQHTAAEAQPPKHPLDALTANEYWKINETLRAAGHLSQDTLFASLVLHEPNKQAVLAWKEGQPFTREADVVLIDKDKAFESRVDIANAKVETWHEIPAPHAPVTRQEEDEVADVALKDPRVLAALKKRGITDLSAVYCEPSAIAFVVYEEQRQRRIGYGNCSYIHGTYLEWGHSIEGLYLKADITNKQILAVIDTGVVPVAKESNDYQEAQAVALPGTQPIQVLQPNGPSFTIEKGEVSWQNWRFRFRIDPRLGPILNLVSYIDQGRPRSVLYEASLSEMFVPYQDPAEYWNQQVYLDAGEYLHDGLVLALAPEIDCPLTARYFDGIVRSDHGAPLLRSNLVCMFERTTGDPAWRHLENGVISGRPSRELVLRSAAVVGNYDYLMDWIFQQDGTIRVAVGATGMMSTKGVEAVKTDDHISGEQTGVLVAPNTLAVNHDHFFSFRLDLDVDGPNNSFMIDRLVTEPMKSDTTRKSLWVVQPAMAHTEKEAILDQCLDRPAMWTFINPQQHSSIGHASGYMIMPGANAVSLMSPDDPAQKVAAFAEHQLWVTPYQPDELYAAGTYVTSSEGKDGLGAWTQANRPIENTDIVAWYTLGFHHVPRVEDWPVMPVLWHDFLIRPNNFFTENPVLTLPKTP